MELLSVNMWNTGRERERERERERGRAAGKNIQEKKKSRSETGSIKISLKADKKHHTANPRKGI